MNEFKRIIYLVLIMTTVTLIGVATALYILYETALNEQRARLMETVQSQARLIEAISRFDALYSADYPHGIKQATLSQITDAHERYQGFGETGEFTLAERKGDQIVFLLSHRHADMDNPRPIPFDSELAEPMRRALSGRSGTVVDLDYRGESVLAAYEPVKELHLGIVAKIDLDEVKAPFVRAAAGAGSCAILLAVIGAALFFYISNPMIRRLRDNTVELQRSNEQLQAEIADRKRTEAKLQMAHTRLLSHIENSPLAVVEWDKDIKYTRWSPMAEHIFGWSAKEVLAKSPSDFGFVHEEDQETTNDVITRLLSGQETRNVCHNRNYCRDGSVIFCEWYNSALFDQEGNLISILSLVQDVTEREGTKEALRESEERYRSLFENSRDAILMTTRDGTYIEVNQAALHLFGYTRDEMLAMNARRTYVNPDDREGVFKEIESKGYVKDYELRLKKKDGTEIDCITTTTLRQNDAGTVNEVQGIIRDITEKKRTEKRLQQERDRAQNYLDIAGAIILVIDADQTISLVNRKGCEVLGYEEEEIVGENWFDNFLPEAIREEVRAYFTQLMAEALEPPEYTHVNPILTKSGEERNISWITAFLRDEEGRIVSLLSSGMDITERVQAEKALRESEAQYKGIFNSATDAFFIFDLEGNLREVNSQACTLYGYPHEELIELSGKDFVHPDYYHLHKQFIRDVPENKEFEAESVEVRQDGTLFNADIRGTKFDYKGEPHMLAIVRDITDRKLAEKELVESEEKFREIIAQAMDGISLTNQDGQILEWNQRLEEITGLKREEVLGRSIWDVTYRLALPDNQTQEGYAQVRQGVSEYLETGQSPFFGRILERGIRRADGTIRKIEYVTYPIHVGDHLFIGTSARDITERKSLEAQLQQSQKMEAIGTLAGGIAHDFNNLLAVIQGQTSFMDVNMGRDNPYSHNIADIQQAIDRGVSLTRQLLGFAEKGKYEVKPIDLNELILKSSQMFCRTRKELKISCEYEKNIWAVDADEGQIEQVLLNLYVNAAQAMPRGGELHLHTENVTLTEAYVRRYNEKPGRYVKIVVSDTGEGMDEETQKKVFDPFFTTRGPGQGSGLGLASAYGIVKNHDGIVEVASTKGKGTTFTIYLPASRKKVAKTKEQVTVKPKKGQETILLVDDEALIIRAALANLVSLGYEVLTAEGGEEALTIYENNKDTIDLVILDMIMPGMGGGETYDRLKEMDPEVKVILSSGYSIDGQAQEILDRGCNGFIQKPFKPAEFSQKIREMLDV